MLIEGVKGAGMTYQGSVSNAVTKPEQAVKTEDIEVKQVSENLADMETDMTVKAGADENAGNSDAGQRQNLGTEAMKRAVEEINKNATNSVVQFGVHEATNRMTIKILDKDTKKVIKEFPPEKTLDIIAKVWEMAGIIVDEKR